MKTQGKITYVLQTITIIPLFFFAIFIMILSYQQFSHTMYAEIETELKNVAQGLQTLLDVAYPGDYFLTDGEAVSLYKGENDITQEYTLVDSLKENTGMDITLFYQGVRMLTTIHDSNNKRLTGSSASQIILNDVLYTGQPHFYFNTLINNEQYFSYYMPLYNSDGAVVGMLFVGKPTAHIKHAVMQSLYPLLYSVLLVMLIIAICMFIYTRKFTAVLLKIKEFLSEVSTGNLNTVLDSSVSQRNDELGEIGRSAVNMQGSLRTLVELDALTELFNRRSGNRKLQNLIKKSTAKGTVFSIALGDIDFFKKVNDTYGHDCGDEVLRRVSALFREHMQACGFAVRWGGEEFLLVFDCMNLDEAHKSLQKLMDRIRAMEIPYKDQTIRVTMTFGMADSANPDITQMVKEADDKLYVGKTGGRNQIIR